MSKWPNQGKCEICGFTRELYLYKGRYYCWMDLEYKKDKDNSEWIEPAYKKFRKLVSRFKSSE